MSCAPARRARATARAQLRAAPAIDGRGDIGDTAGMQNFAAANPAHVHAAKRWLWIAVLIAPINVGLWLYLLDQPSDWGLLLMTGLAGLQALAGLLALIAGIRAVASGRPAPGSGIAAIILGPLFMLGAPVAWALGLATFAMGSGGAWGRPLRIRGRQRHPSLRAGSDWTQGARPSPAGLDEPTRAALEALWLHDAQKEHASVPAFSRISWLLAAVGAPADLMAWSHRAALEEIEHTRRCFALAAGYAGRSHSVEPMPELLLGGLDLKGDPRAVLAAESLADGCQLEDFNADVAAACARVCEEPVTRAVLEQIAAEERSHAEFSWALVAWLLQRDRPHVEAALREALAALSRYPRPTAVSDDKRALVAAADPGALLRHGRLPDARWAEIWDTRMLATTARITALLADDVRRAA